MCVEFNTSTSDARLLNREVLPTLVGDVLPLLAQKYGLRDGYNHNAGIVFADTPFVLSVYSYQAGGNEMIGRLAELFAQYTEE